MITNMNKSVFLRIKEILIMISINKKIIVHKMQIFIILLIIYILVFFVFSCNKQSDGIITQNEFGIDVYKSTNGKSVSNEWVKVDGYYYYVNSIGQIEKNAWIDNLYYVGPNGRMYHNYWLNDDFDGDNIKDWYYFEENGKALKDILIPIGEYEYCFGPDMKMIQDSFYYYELENRMVYCGFDGRVRKDNDLIEVQGLKYYVDEIGNVLSNQWVLVDGKWYYLTESGAVANNTWIDNMYYVGEDGAMLQSDFAPDGTYLNENGDIAWQNVISKELKNAKVSSTYLMGKYEQDNDVSNGKEDIEWKILYKDKNKALLYTKFVIDNIRYNDEDVDITWENSTIRKWLNEEFLDNVFSKEEKNLIVEVLNDNNKNEIYGTDSGNKTNDKVFLLSIEECQKYFGKSTKNKDGYNVNTKLATAGTDYAISKGLLVEKTKDKNKSNSPFWLRNAGILSNFATGVDIYGDVNSEGGNNVVNELNGLRVAIWVRF